MQVNGEPSVDWDGEPSVDTAHHRDDDAGNHQHPDAYRHRDGEASTLAVDGVDTHADRDEYGRRVERDGKREYCDLALIRGEDQGAR